MSAVVTHLLKSAAAYAAAKQQMDAVVASVRDERSMVSVMLDRQADPLTAYPEDDHREQMAICREVITGLDQQLGAAIATWRGTVFELQAAALAVVGVSRPVGCGRREWRLHLAAQAYAAAKIDVDGHAGPFSGVVYASKLATWRGAMMDLDAAARTFAGATLKEGQTA